MQFNYPRVGSIIIVTTEMGVRVDYKMIVGWWEDSRIGEFGRPELKDFSLRVWLPRTLGTAGEGVMWSIEEELPVLEALFQDTCRKVTGGAAGLKVLNKCKVKVAYNSKEDEVVARFVRDGSPTIFWRKPKESTGVIRGSEVIEVCDVHGDTPRVVCSIMGPETWCAVVAYEVIYLLL